MQDFDQHLNAGWWALRIGLGVGPIITGIDKYFNKLADWSMYLSPIATKVLPKCGHALACCECRVRPFWSAYSHRIHCRRHTL